MTPRLNRLLTHTLDLARSARSAWQARRRPAADGPASAAAPPGPATPAGGMGARWLAGEHHHRSGGRRSYRLYLPAGNATAPRPLLLMLHGCTQDAEDFATGTGMNTLAGDGLGWLVLYPEQSRQANPSRCWSWFKTPSQQRGRGEAGWLESLTRRVMAEQAVDPSRVYVAGLSAGGAMAAILGQACPDLFAAVGVHSGLPAGAAHTAMGAFMAMREGAPPQALRHLGPPVPTVVFHGDADLTVNPVNGEQVLQAALARWPQAVPSVHPHAATAHQLAHVQRLWRDPQGRPCVAHWSVQGLGHAWSGGRAPGRFTHPGGPDASREMLRFFQQCTPHTAPGTGTNPQDPPR
ncbi:extracellular catalytic domain type 1 short-chain-length polyhydroxyalkanoate depolymerase [Ideonella livida]|uniref:PHB depolymerase family esterase n=1 Tax=Ideonella livida TaxID=2707176 RepID=A0A7C9TPA0_9BURK|nr:PHB depolymerase family esterase [Ideonella livida]NDY93546.1 PHB depolymerase family esterase [Ideonella livida]